MGHRQTRWIAVAVVVLVGAIAAHRPIAAQGEELTFRPSIAKHLLQADELSDPLLASRSIHETHRQLFRASSTEEKFSTKRFLGMSWLTPTDASPEREMIAQHPLRTSFLRPSAIVLKQPVDRKHSTLLLTTDTAERMTNSQDAGVIATVSLQF